MKFSNVIYFLSFLLMLGMVSCASDGNKAEEAAETVAEKTTDAAETVADAAQQVAQQSVPEGPTTTMSFEETEWDFGKITDGDKVQHVFKFTNTGDEPLTISNAKGSCGCTVPKWPKEPIAPGATGEINVEFNSKKKPGMQTKRVTITANTEPPQSYLNIKADVQPNPEAEEATK